MREEEPADSEHDEYEEQDYKAYISKCAISRQSTLCIYVVFKSKRSKVLLAPIAMRDGCRYKPLHRLIERTLPQDTCICY